MKCGGWAKELIGSKNGYVAESTHRLSNRCCRSFLQFSAFHYDDIDGRVGTICSGNNFVALFGDQGSCMVSCCYGQFFDTHFLAPWWRCECCIHKGFLNMLVIGSISAASCTYKSCVFSIFALFRNTCNTFLLDKGFKGHHDIIVCYFRLWKFFCLLHTGHTCQMWLCGGFKSQNSFYRS